MKTKNKLLIMLSVMGLTVAPLIAYADRGCDDERKSSHHMMERMDKMSERLNLSESQKTEVEAIMKKYKPEHDRQDERKAMRQHMMTLDPSSADYDVKLKEQADAAADKMRTRIVEMGSMRKELNAVLTEEQRSKMSDMMKRREERKHRRWFGDDD